MSGLTLEEIVARKSLAAMATRKEAGECGPYEFCQSSRTVYDCHGNTVVVLADLGRFNFDRAIGWTDYAITCLNACHGLNPEKIEEALEAAHCLLRSLNDQDIEHIVRKECIQLDDALLVVYKQSPAELEKPPACEDEKAHKALALLKTLIHLPRGMSWEQKSHWLARFQQHAQDIVAETTEAKPCPA